MPRPDISDETARRLNEKIDEIIKPPTESLSYDDRLDLLLDELEQASRERQHYKEKYEELQKKTRV
jgi:hypothetical protein